MSLHDIPKRLMPKRERTTSESPLSETSAEQAVTQLFRYANFYRDFMNFQGFAEQLNDRKSDHGQKYAALEALTIVHQSLKGYERNYPCDPIIPKCMGFLRERYASTFVKLNKPREK